MKKDKVKRRFDRHDIIAAAGILALFLLVVVFYATPKKAKDTAEENAITPSLVQAGEIANADDNMSNQERLLDTLTVAQTVETEVSADEAEEVEEVEEVEAPSDDVDETEEIAEVLRVPVVLAKDSSFWYDQNCNEMSLEEAEAILDEHDEYCWEILYLNSNECYLSAWQSKQRLDKIDELWSVLITSKAGTTYPSDIVKDETCKEVANSAINTPAANMQTFAQMAEQVKNNEAAKDISELVLAIWKRQIIDDHDVADYIFWNTTAQLVEDETYAMEDINNSIYQKRKDSIADIKEQYDSLVGKPTSSVIDVSKNQAPTTDSSNLSRYDNMTNAEIIAELNEMAKDKGPTTFDAMHPDVYFDQHGRMHGTSSNAKEYYATSNGYVYEVPYDYRFEDVIQQGGSADQDSIGKFVGKTNRRIKQQARKSCSNVTAQMVHI